MPRSIGTQQFYTRIANNGRCRVLVAASTLSLALVAGCAGDGATEAPADVPAQPAAAPSPMVARSPVAQPAASPVAKPAAAPSPTEAIVQGIATTIESITENPDAWIGERVIVSGEVDDVGLLPRGFTIENDEFLGLLDDELLIISADQFPLLPTRTQEAPVVPDDIVQVIGTVRRFQLAETEQELGVELPDDQFQDREGELAIVADRVSFTVLGARRTVPIPAAARPPIPSPAPSPVPPVPEIIPRTAVASLGATVDEITDNPSPWYGRRVTVAGEIDDQGVLGPRAFTIEDNDLIFDEHLLVVARNPLPTIGDRPIAAPIISRDVLQVTGTVREFRLGEIEQEIGQDLLDESLQEFEGQPVLLADEVTFIALGPRVVPEPVDPDIAPTPTR